MADKPKKIIPDAEYKRLMPKFRAHVISESAAKRLGLTDKSTSKAPLKTPPVKKPTPPEKPVEPKAKSSALKKKVVDDAPITISKGKRGATKWRKGNGPWRYDEPPQQHKPKVVEPHKVGGPSKVANRGQTPPNRPAKNEVAYDHSAHMATVKRLDRRKQSTSVREKIISGGTTAALSEAFHVYSPVRDYTMLGDVIVNGWLRHGTKSGRADQMPEWHNKKSDLALAVNSARWAMEARGEKWDFKNPPQIPEIKALKAHENSGATETDFSGFAKQLVKGIDEFIKDRTLKANVTTFRGASMSEAAFGSLAKGATFTDAGYVSTSLNKSMATTFAKKKDGNNVRVLFEIRAPQGAHAAYLDEFSANAGEHEILLPRGSRFKVLSVETPPGGVGLHKVSVALV